MLPPEILFQIFYNLTSIHDLFSVQLVCKQFACIVNILRKQNKIRHLYFSICNIVESVSKYCEQYDLSQIKNIEQVKSSPLSKSHCFTFYQGDSKLFVQFEERGKCFRLCVFSGEQLEYRFISHKKLCFHLKKTDLHQKHVYASTTHNNCKIYLEFFENAAPVTNHQFRITGLICGRSNYYCNLVDDYSFTLSHKFNEFVFLVKINQSSFNTGISIRTKHHTNLSWGFCFSADWLLFSGTAIFSNCGTIYVFHEMVIKSFNANNKYTLRDANAFFFRDFQSSFLWIKHECYKVIFVKIVKKQFNLTTQSEIDDIPCHGEFYLVRCTSCDLPHTFKKYQIMTCPRNQEFFFVSKNNRCVLTMPNMHQSHRKV